MTSSLYATIGVATSGANQRNNLRGVDGDTELVQLRYLSEYTVYGGLVVHGQDGVVRGTVREAYDVLVVVVDCEVWGEG